jgi:UDP-N-acetyl-D-galactosamine dehydrogenase
MGLAPLSELKSNEYDAVILAVAYDQFRQMSIDDLKTLAKEKYILYDLKYILNQSDVNIRL